MNFELRAIDRHFADFVCGTSVDNRSPVWLCAALVSLSLGNGDTCLQISELAGKTVMVDGCQYVLPINTELSEILLATDAIGLPGDSTPLVLDAAGGRLYLHRYWHYETTLADRVRELATAPCVLDMTALKQGLKELFEDSEEQPDWQVVAAIAAASRRFCVISGGPGTGKTSTVVRIIALLLQQPSECPLRIALAAPTGKAAARLKESISRTRAALNCPDTVRGLIPDNVLTLHRLLGSIPGSSRFRHTAGNPLPYDLIIVDEASMVDLPLMAKLVAALGSHARLLLLGDRNQLASVEAGAVLGDLCGNGRPEPFSEQFCQLVQRMTGYEIAAGQGKSGETGLTDTLVLLRKNYRFNRQSAIASLAGLVLEGDGEQALQLLRSGSAAGLAWQDLPSAKDMKRALRPLINQVYHNYFAAPSAEEALLQLDRFRVLCAVRDGRYGVNSINLLIEELLQEIGIDTGGRWYRGRPIMITTNDYALGLFNGDIGVLFPDQQGQLKACFLDQQGCLRQLSTARLPSHETVYAMTVHKSQGSEFDRVLIVLPDVEHNMLSRELLYTGITRARDEIEIWSDCTSLTDACSRKGIRSSGLADALWG